MRSWVARLGLVSLLALLAACGGGSGSNPTPPSITAHPQNVTVVQNQSATFSVSAGGTTPLSYQWRKGGTPVAGGGAALLTISSAQPGDAGSYDVVVSNSAGSATSNPATLTVNVPPSITAQPQNQTVLAPAAATFTVTAAGTAPLAYQWKRNGADIAGANAASYTTSATSLADDGTVYTVAVSNVAGSQASAAATLTVHAGAAITVQPQPQSVIAPAAATFSVTATGTAPLAYLWKKNGVDIGGATGSTYTTPATGSADNGAAYSVVVSNAYGTDTSASAVLTVNLPPSITAQPQSQSVLAPAAATFSVTATGTPPLSYQWRKNGADITGATAASYTTPATSTADSGAVFTVVVSSPYGTATSSAATLTVTSAPVPPTITVQPANQTVTAPATATFSVTATGTLPLSYQWKRGGADIGGATASTYTTPATAFADNGAQFTVTVSNTAGSANSNPATLTVNAGPTIVVQPANQTVTAPAAATFSVNATGTAPLTYQWKKNGADIPGATGSSYTTPATTTGDSGSIFSVVVSNAYGSALSSAATLTVNAPGAVDLSLPVVYITQSTQTQSFNVPLVKDRDGYLRAFAVANAANTATPQVRVRIYNAASSLLQTYIINAPGASVPLAVNEASLANSWNVAIPASLIQPGNKLLVDVDPTNAIAESNESNNTWPASGSAQTLDVRTLNPFRVTFWAVQTGDLRVGNVNAGLITGWTSLLEKIWPTNNATDRVYGGTWTTSVASLASGGGGWSTCLSELYAKRTADGVTNRYYYGVVNPNYSGGVAGLGYVGAPTAIGWDKSAGYSDSGQYPGVYAHETGHNFGLSHAPCGGAGGPDPSYPYAGGLIGVWGTDVAGPTLKDPAVWTDIMGYCSNVWVSDYNFKIVLANREGGGVPIIEPGPGDHAELRSLLIWGRMENGEAVLEPAFHMAVDTQPPEAGDQLLEGFDAAGSRLFAVPFGLTEVGCMPAGDARAFSFSMPLSKADAARLAELRWSKAGELLARQTAAAASSRAWEPMAQPMFDGRTRLLWDAAARPLVMVRDRATGLVLGFGRGGELRLATETENLELHFSDGVHSSVVTLKRPRLGE